MRNWKEWLKEDGPPNTEGDRMIRGGELLFYLIMLLPFVIIFLLAWWEK